MGLKIYGIVAPWGSHHINADDLEKALQDAPFAAGVVDSPEWYTYKKGLDIQPKNMDGKDVYQARLVCIQPVKKQNKAERIADLVEEWAISGDILNYKYLREAMDKILEMPE